MRVREVSVTYERKINTGNYSSATIGIGLLADLDEAESPEDAVKALQVKARGLAKEEAMRLLKPANGQQAAAEGAPPAVSDPAFREKVEQSQQGPSIVKPPAPQGAAPPAGAFPAGGSSVADLGY